MNILFLSTHNTCRSILSEAIFNNLAPEGLRAVSAGYSPDECVNSLTLNALAREGISSEGLLSKPVKVFEQCVPDVVITVCENAASRPLPMFLGGAINAHWKLNNPLEVTGTEAQINTAINECVIAIKKRVDILLALPLSVLSLNKQQFQAALNGIGSI